MYEDLHNSVACRGCDGSRVDAGFPCGRGSNEAVDLVGPSEAQSILFARSRAILRHCPVGTLRFREYSQQLNDFVRTIMNKTHDGTWCSKSRLSQQPRSFRLLRTRLNTEPLTFGIFLADLVGAFKVGFSLLFATQLFQTLSASV